MAGGWLAGLKPAGGVLTTPLDVILVGRRPLAAR